MDGVEANWGGRGSFFDPYNNNPGADFLTAADDLSLAETAGTSSLQLPRIVTCGDEMESLCRAEMSRGRHTISGFPPMCLPIVRLLGGNHCCVDCGEEDQVSPQIEPSSNRSCPSRIEEHDEIVPNIDDLRQALSRE